jgi:hypothetical protein
VALGAGLDEDEFRAMMEEAARLADIFKRRLAG